METGSPIQNTDFEQILAIHTESLNDIGLNITLIKRTLMLLGRILEAEERNTNRIELSDDRSRQFDALVSNLIHVLSENGALHSDFFDSHHFRTYKKFLEDPLYLPITSLHANYIITILCVHMIEPAPIKKDHGIQIGPFCYKVAHASIYRGDAAVAIFTPSENQIFKRLVESPNAAIEIQTLLGQPGLERCSERLLRTHIVAIRKKTKCLRTIFTIETISTVGYCLEFVDPTHTSRSRA